MEKLLISHQYHVLVGVGGWVLVGGSLLHPVYVCSASGQALSLYSSCELIFHEDVLDLMKEGLLMHT